ncbi:MAG: zinc-dependent metalloprotease [Calothrix sp. C42_A2020_038]|nr:zinc-dependent metalloprotease [Calothrix sp. C42_A2020_038]
MNNWIVKVVICGLLLWNCLFGIDVAVASQIQGFDQEFAVASVDGFASSENRITERKEASRRYREISRGGRKLDGLFTVYHYLDTGEVYLEVRPEQLNQNYLATVTLESGIGENGIYSGLPLQDCLFYLQRINNSLQFVVRNVKFRTETDVPEVRSLKRSFTDSVIGAVEIVGIDAYSKSLLINLGDLLMQDFAGLTPLLKSSLQADYHLEESRSYFDDVHSFPLNLEIDSVYGFSSKGGAYLMAVPDSRAISLSVHYSFSQLPENNGYIPRLADDRVGYFITAFQDYSHNRSDDVFVRYINRWHLEPSNPDLPLSVPKKPIVFWIENAVPLEYRDAIKEGILMWNRAFEQAGFENAIQVKQMPDDADWQPADVRYNTVRWFNSLDAGFARGPARVNPLTGEILDADIIIDASMVRSLENEYRALIKGNSTALTEFSSQKPNLSQENAGKNSCVSDNDVCYGAESSFQAAMGALALSLLNDTIPSSEQMHKYVHEYLRYLIAHEVGHTLGLRHNFHGSTMLAPEELNNPEITHTLGLTGSVMDYLPVNIAPSGVTQGDYFPTVIGPYDKWAIVYGYRQLPNNALDEKVFLEQIAAASPQPELSYATDEDIWDVNPLANAWDMSKDVLKYSQSQLDNARIMWKRLDQRYPRKGDSYSNLRVLFNRVFNYYGRNANLLVQYIAGQSFGRHHADENTQWAFVPTSKQKQQQALTKLLDYVFAENAFNFSPQLLNQLAPSRWQHWGHAIPISRLDYPIHSRIFNLQSNVLRSLLDGERLNRLLDIELKTAPENALTIPELFDTLQQGIWSEVLTDSKPQLISSIRRSLQREHLNILLDMVLRNVDVPEDASTIAWYQLNQLQAAINTSLKYAKNLNTYTLAHLEQTSARISQAVNAQLQTH